MGNEANKPRLSKKRIIITALLLIFIVIISLCLIIIRPAQMIEKKIIINKIENSLDIKLPKISTYKMVDYNDWLSFNNTIYPQKMYYLVFKDEIVKTDETWYEELPQEIIDKIPIGSSEYPYICDYYKLVDLTRNTINEISSNDEIHQYILYCLQIENKRLIAIEFEV